MRKNLETIAKYCLYASFFVPLAVFPSSFIFPFIVPKILLFRSLIMVSAGAYLLLCLIEPAKFRPRFTPLTWAVLAFFLSFTISTFTGVDTYHSFWDNHERMLGLFTIIHYLLYYFIASAIVTNWTEWKKALRVFLIAGSLVMLVGLIQVVNPNFLLNQGSERVIATLGNSIYVGGYGLFLFFIGYLLFIKEQDTVWKVIEAVGGLLGLLVMFFSGTRGSMLGLAVGFAAAVLAYALTIKGKPRLRQALGGALIGGVILVGFLYVFRTSDFVRSIPAVGRTLNTSWVDVSRSPRMIAWRIGVEAWKDKPVFGWGPNNYFYAFNHFYNPASLEFGYGETWFDNAHNIIVNTMAVQGTFGIVTYLAIFIVAIYSLLRGYRRGQTDLHVSVVIGSFLVAHFVQNITVFENPTSYLYFFLILALVNRLTSDRYAGVESVSTARALGSGMRVAVWIVVALFIFVCNLQPARANWKSLSALRALSRDLDQGLTLAKEALAFNSPHVDDIRSDVSRSLASTAESSLGKIPAEKSREVIAVAEQALLANTELHPLDIRAFLALAHLGQLSAQLSNDGRYIMAAEKYLNSALELSPRRQQVIYTLVGVKMQLGKNPEAVKLLEGAISDNPRIGESYWRLAYVYKIMNQLDKARATIDLAKERGIQFNEPEQEIISDILGTPPATAPKK